MLNVWKTLSSVLDCSEIYGTVIRAWIFQITTKHGNNFGQYIDDDLGISIKSPREVELINKDLCAIFRKHGLKFTIEANNKRVEFFIHNLLNLTNGKRMPYTPIIHHCMYAASDE